MNTALLLTLETIARELREYADAAHGNPQTVRITAATLSEYADIIDKVVAAAALASEE